MWCPAWAPLAHRSLSVRLGTDQMFQQLYHICSSFAAWGVLNPKFIFEETPLYLGPVLLKFCKFCFTQIIIGLDWKWSPDSGIAQGSLAFPLYKSVHLISVTLSKTLMNELSGAQTRGIPLANSCAEFIFHKPPGSRPILYNFSNFNNSSKVKKKHLYFLHTL